jgi:tubulin polyglutamylase TTLL7
METSANAGSPKTPGKRLLRSKGSVKAAITANLANTNYAMVRQVVDEIGAKQTDNAAAMDCNLLWFDTCPPPSVFSSLKSYQRVNHFPNTGEITRKDSLARNLNLVAKACPDSIKFNFFPRSWILPAEAQALRTHSAKAKSKGKTRTFIYKPTNGARGEGIALTRNIDAIPDNAPMLVQEYLGNPYLVDGHKFDLRLYVLISSVDPLRMFLFHDGLVRLSTKPYKPPTAKNMSNICMHLTNYSINKHSETFENTDEGDTGSKRSYAWLLQHLREEGHDINLLQQRINDCLIKTTAVALPYMFKGYDACKRQARASTARSSAMDANMAAAQASPASRKEAPEASLCFEVLGFDVYLSKSLKPYIIEVNRAPSFSCDSQLDTDIKHDVLYASLRLLRMKGSDRSKSERSARQSSLQRLVRAGSQATMPSTKAGDDSEVAGAAGAALSDT